MNYYYPFPPYYPVQGYTGYPQYPTSGTNISGIPQQFDTDESSYIENILRLNLGKVVSIYMNFENLHSIIIPHNCNQNINR